jgi:hypothetical protein
MESNNLMTNDVIARRKLAGKDSGDFEAILDQLVGGPGSRADDAGLGDLGPAECAWSKTCAIA